jgi:hypothetical protein
MAHALLNPSLIIQSIGIACCMDSMCIASSAAASSSKISMFTDLCRSHANTPMPYDSGPEPPSHDIGFIANCELKAMAGPIARAEAERVKVARAEAARAEAARAEAARAEAARTEAARAETESGDGARADAANSPVTVVQHI